MFEKKPVHRKLISPDGKQYRIFLTDGAGSNGKTRAEYNGFVKDNRDWKEVEYER